MKTWLFFDYWHIEHQDNLALRQGIPTWRPEATYEDAAYDSIGFWPAVYRDETAGLWRMLYFAIYFPLTIMAAESEDGIHWRPSALPEIRPEGPKLAPNHIFTVTSASGGPVYIDPVAADGYRFKIFCTERGGPTRAGPASARKRTSTSSCARPWASARTKASTSPRSRRTGCTGRCTRRCAGAGLRILPGIPSRRSPASTVGRSSST